MITKFKVIGEPMGKQRPRAAVINGFARIHNTKDNIAYESYVIDRYLSEIGEIRHTGCISLKINVFYGIEKKHFGKKGLNAEGKLKLEGKIFPTKKPDIDNIAKIIMDALNGVAYDDDKQVCVLEIRKFYTIELPYTEIIIESDGVSDGA